MVAVVVVGGSSPFFLLNQSPPPALDKLYKSNALTPTPTPSCRWRRSCSSRWVARVSVVRAFGPDGDAVSSSSSSSSTSSSKKKVVSSSNYVVPFDSSSSCITRPLAEILRDLNKRIPDNIIIKPTALPQDHDHDQSQAQVADQNQNQDQDQDQDDDHIHTSKTYIPWYHANRMLSFYAPGWCGEIRDVIFSDNGSVSVVYRVTIRGSDGEAHRESTGTVSQPMDGHVDAVAAAEEIAFCRACARFGLGLYLYHDE